MGKILDAFVSNQLHVEPVPEKRTKHHQYLCEQMEKLQNELKERLNDEEKEMLMELIDTIFEESCCDVTNKFVRGYRLGVLMTMEVFMEQDSFMGDEG